MLLGGIALVLGSGRSVVVVSSLNKLKLVKTRVVTVAESNEPGGNALIETRERASLDDRVIEVKLRLGVVIF